jgi:hypothetical protein
MAWPVRYKLVGLLAGGSAINYADRVNISVAAPAMMASLGWDEARFGIIFSAFLLGYGILQIPAGALADRWGAKLIIAWACVGFSLFTALTPLGGSSFALLLAIRFCVGLFESMTFPSYASLNSRWIPRAEYSRAQTLSLSGVYIGQTLRTLGRQLFISMPRSAASGSSRGCSMQRILQQRIRKLPQKNCTILKLDASRRQMPLFRCPSGRSSKSHRCYGFLSPTSV